jgi:MFS family permease
VVQVQSKGTSQPQTKIWNQMFVSIFVANIALNFGQQMSNSLLAKYADSMGAPASQIGMLMSMFAVTALALRFVAGPAMDTYNRKYLVMGAMGVMTLAYFGFSFSKSISALMVFRLVQGCGNAFANVACLAMVSDALPIDKFGTGMGYYSLAQVIAQAIAPTVGLILADHIGYSRAYVIIGMVMIVAILIASRIKLHFVRTRKFRITLNNIIAKEAVFPGAILLLMMMGFQTINSFLIVFASKQGISSNIGLFFTVYALTLLISRPLIGELTDRYGLFKVAIPAMCLAGISFLIISSATSIGSNYQCIGDWCLSAFHSVSWYKSGTY